MTIQQIEYFFLVVEQGSFSKASEQAYVSQPAISKQITLLEKELEITLFDRRYRSAVLTPQGEIIHETIKRQREEFQAACQEAKRRYGLWNKTIWIGIPGGCGLGNFHEVLGRCQRQHPEMRLRVYAGAGKDLGVRSCGEGYDLVLTTRLLDTERLRTQTQTIYHGNYMMLVSDNNPRCHEGILPDEMNGENIYLAVPDELVHEVRKRQQITRKYALIDSEVIVLPTEDSVIGAVRAGLGVGIVNDLITVPSSYGIKRIPLDEPYELELAWRKENNNFYLPMLRELILNEVVIAPE